MKKVTSLKTLSATLVIGFAMLMSCTKSSDAILSSTNTTSVNSESSADSYTSETADIANSVTTNAGNSTLAGNAREEASVTISGERLKRWDKRLACATVTITRTGDKLNPSGTITITWGTTTCTDTTGVQRKGTITIAYAGYWFEANSTRTITYSNYSRNNIQIGGTYTVTTLTTLDTASTSMQFKHTLANGQITFPNGKSVTRIQDITVQWDIQYTDKIFVAVDYKHLAGGTASGTLENGNTYSMTITKDLLYTVQCLLDKVFIPVSGTKTIIITPGSGGTTITVTIDYGNGTCNSNQATVTVNGKSETVTINGDGD
jgi:hypothetical protein